MCLKRTLPLAVLLLEKVQRKRQKKEKLNTTPSLKYSKTESLLFFSLANILSSCKYSGYH